MNDLITKEEMINILEDTIYYLEKDVSAPFHDIRDYEHLSDNDYNNIAEEMVESINDLLLKRRTRKINKIQKVLKNNN